MNAKKLNVDAAVLDRCKSEGGPFLFYHGGIAPVLSNGETMMMVAGDDSGKFLASNVGQRVTTLTYQPKWQ